MEGLLKQQLIVHAPCGLFSFDDEGRILMANATLHTILGYAAGELNGRKTETMLNLASRIFYQTHFFPLLKLQERADEIFMTFITSDKQEIPVLLNAQRVCELGVYSNLCALIPVHHRRKYEDELLQAKKASEKALRENQELNAAKLELEQNQEALDRHISKLEQSNVEINQIKHIISHDMQEPIRKIALFSDILEKQVTFSPEGNDARVVERIKQSAEKALHLINDLQTFISISMSDLHCAPIELGKLLAEISQKTKRKEPAGKMMVEIDVPHTIEGDYYQIKTLFEQLISNSVKFIDPLSTLIIRVTGSLVHHNSFKAIEGKFKYSEFVKISFSDNGFGFDNQYNNYVFKIMKKVDQGTSGLGFGLAFCKKIVDNHYGSISAESAAGQGTNITILLPVKQFEC
jgi:sigma-B regulation protein RsbU (phosphoserine phosphatase)